MLRFFPLPDRLVCTSKVESSHVVDLAVCVTLMLGFFKPIGGISLFWGMLAIL